MPSFLMLLEPEATADQLSGIRDGLETAGATVTAALGPHAALAEADNASLAELEALDGVLGIHSQPVPFVSFSMDEVTSRMVDVWNFVLSDAYREIKEQRNESMSWDPMGGCVRG